ncbi:MAG: hypothetical protein ACYSTT_00880 [Planctomycetota bacterium]|jgi:hypothetical protein
MTRMKRRQYVAIVIFIFGMIFLGVTFIRYVPPLLFRTLIKTLKGPQASPEEMFRGYVMSPIPKSVTNIKADQPKNFGGYRYTFRFNINRGDLALLTDSRPFVRIWDVEYVSGSIFWRWDHPDGRYGSAIICYDHTREPSWFKPGLWDNPEAYAFYKVGHLINIQAFERDKWNLGGRVTTQVLLYNEKEGEAYFIISSWEN